MKKILILLAMFLFALVGNMMADDYGDDVGDIYYKVEKTNITQGGTAAITFYYDANAEAYFKGFQVTFILPEGFKIAPGAKLGAELAAHNPELNLVFGERDNGNSQPINVFIAFQVDTTNFPTGQGIELFTFYVSCDEDVSLGEYSFTTTQLEIAFTKNGESCYCSPKTMILNVISKPVSIPGDINGDGVINITDVTLIVNLILGNSVSNFNETATDINGDGVINITDVTSLVDIILNGITKPILTCPDNNHPHAINLGLPSGTLWSCCNVGADTPEAYGGHYSWGETIEKNDYKQDTYQYYNGSTEYQDIGYDIAGTEYDVAHVTWGGCAVMPSMDQIRELVDNCSYTWTTKNGIKGGQFTGPNGGTIFLPAAGIPYNGHLLSAAYYWSSTLFSNPSNYAFRLDLSSSRAAWNVATNRFYGYSVRPVYSLALSTDYVEVIVGKSSTVEITRGSGSYKVRSSNPNVLRTSLSGSTITITGVAYGATEVVVTDATGCSIQFKVFVVYKESYLTCPDDNHPHLIDLRLPSGTKWACCNVDSDHPEKQSPTNYGGYYALGETSEKKVYNEETYQYCTGVDNNGDGWNDDWQYQNLGSDIAGTQYDVAHVQWGDFWVMPSTDQIDELIDNCYYEWITMNGVDGGLFTASNGGSIFLPATGYRQNVSLNDTGTYGYYWTSTRLPSYWDCGYGFVLFSDNTYWGYNRSYYGYGVRPVYK